jgi:hypothetical protein
MEGLKNLAIVVLVVFVLWKVSGCSCGCTGRRKEQSHPQADDRRPTDPGGVRPQGKAGCNPFACGTR